MNNSDLCWMAAGRRYDGVTVLRASAAFEAAHPWAQRRPDVG